MGINNLRKIVLFACLFSSLLLCVAAITGCGSVKSNYNPNAEFPRQKLEEDYTLFRNILEDAHPSLYWYTSKDSLDYFFNYGFQHIKDSMTEPQFRTLLSYVISKIDCGHTTIRFSKKYARYMDTVRLAQFPIGIKFWDDSAIVYVNINRKDSLLTRGTTITAINDVPIATVRDSLFRYMVMDGYGLNHKYQTLSNIGTFGGLYQAVFGARDSFGVRYIDSSGIEKATSISLYDIRKDTAFRRFVRRVPAQTKKQRKETVLFNARNIQIDTSGSTAFMTVTTFADGNKLRSFFRQSFRTLQERQIKNLVIDLRLNGGGNVALSTNLTRYISDHKFKLADSLYANRRLSRYEQYINNSFGGFFFFNFMTHRARDGKYHFGYFERHYFKPKEKYHYNGNVYVITGGFSFSASTLFVNAVKGQQNVKIVGEETGGGAYGNTAWFEPTATLPNTQLRFTLPRFRMVMNKDYPKNGHGILPDIEVKPASSAIKNGYDYKIEYLRKLISDSSSHQ
ncbi:MAG: S41 family peptidase [Chitinophagaceae bacterium]